MGWVVQSLILSVSTGANIGGPRPAGGAPPQKIVHSANCVHFTITLKFNHHLEPAGHSPFNSCLHSLHNMLVPYCRSLIKRLEIMPFKRPNNFRQKLAGLALGAGGAYIRGNAFALCSLCSLYLMLTFTAQHA